MKNLKFTLYLLLGAFAFILSCSSDSENTDDADDIDVISDNTDDITQAVSTPLSAFDEFNPDAVTVSFDGDEITIESNGLPNHTSPYWDESDDLYIDQEYGDHLTPGRINSGNFIVTVSSAPELAASSSATGLGPIGISVTGAPIFNDQERENLPLDLETTTGFDYAGGHVGPGGYHYHIESADVPENTVLSHDDEQLVGIMADGFLLYGRREMDGSYPTDLDESGGHVSSTQHSESEAFYHYHIINELYINSLFLLFGENLKGTPNSIL
ncbi:YHYH protein [Maribacter sp. IgM3_T14_3]|uniref:YHYH protein n=1 Tax=Maribacter sp. IgM3_T14_3 TaxID=3415140 RepID=UPI003C6EA84A